MEYRYVKINPQLEGFIRTVLLIDSDHKNDSSSLPLFTNGMPSLLCRIENKKIRILLYGDSVPDEQWNIQKDQRLIVYFFQPFMLAASFNLQAKELKKNPTDLNIWNPHKTIALSHQFITAESVEKQIQILDHFIITQIENCKRECGIIRFATDFIISNPSTDVLHLILQELSLSERTFQRLFKKYVGVTPNQFRRICQFHSSFVELKAGKFDTTTEIAFRNGFADQSHFIRSFREFTQTTPKNYLRHGLKKTGK